MKYEIYSGEIGGNRYLILTRADQFAAGTAITASPINPEIKTVHREQTFENVFSFAAFTVCELERVGNRHFYRVESIIGNKQGEAFLEQPVGLRVLQNAALMPVSSPDFEIRLSDDDMALAFHDALTAAVQWESGFEPTRYSWKLYFDRADIQAEGT